MKVVIFDLETLKTADEVGGFHNAKDMGISFVGAWRSDTAMYKTWEGTALTGFLEWLNWADTIVGYNHIDFDYKVLSRVMNVNVLLGKRNIDLIHIVRGCLKRNVSMDSIASSTMGVGKTQGYSGRMAPMLYSEGRIHELITYLLDDVQITVKLFYHILKERYIIYKGEKYQISNLDITIDNEVKQGELDL